MKLTPEHIRAIKTCAMTGARAIRAEGRECAPFLLLFNATVAGDLGDMTAIGIRNADKDQRAALQQRYARSPDIAAAVLINEGWQAVLAPGEEITAASQHPAREKVLIVNVLTRSDQWLLCARIDGTHIDDAEFIKVEGGNLVGRFIREGAQ